MIFLKLKSSCYHSLRVKGMMMKSFYYHSIQTQKDKNNIKNIKNNLQKEKQKLVQHNNKETAFLSNPQIKINELNNFGKNNKEQKKQNIKQQDKQKQNKKQEKNAQYQNSKNTNQERPWSQIIKAKQKDGIFWVLAVTPILFYLIWYENQEKQNVIELLKTKIQIIQSQSKSQNGNQKKSIDNSQKQTQKSLQPLFDIRQAKNFDTQSLLQCEKIKWISAIIKQKEKGVDTKNNIRKFLRKKQDEGFPVLFLDSQGSNNIYKQFLDKNVIKFIYEPAVKLQILSGKTLIRDRRDLIKNHFGDKPVIIAIRIKDDGDDDIKNKKQNQSKWSLFKVKDNDKDKKQKFIKKIIQMQTAFQVGRIKVNFILIFDNIQTFSEIEKLTSNKQHFKVINSKDRKKIQK